MLATKIPQKDSVFYFVNYQVNDLLEKVIFTSRYHLEGDVISPENQDKDDEIMNFITRVERKERAFQRTLMKRKVKDLIDFYNNNCINLNLIITPDSYSFIDYIFPDPVRMPLYPWFIDLGDTMLLQMLLWGITGFLLHKKTGFGILYFTTLGLAMLAQKYLAETLFVSVLTLAVLSKKDMRFVWVCIAYFIKPVMLFFIPVMLLSRPKLKYALIGIIPVIAYSAVLYFTCGTVISTSGADTLFHYTPDIGSYFTNILTNSLGKPVGIEGLLLTRIGQLQVLTYTLTGIAAASCWRKSPLYLFPLYLILISGIAGCQGDRLHIVMVPVCLMFLDEFFVFFLEPPEPELEKYYPTDKPQP